MAIKPQNTLNYLTFRKFFIYPIKRNKRHEFDLIKKCITFYKNGGCKD